MKESMLDQIQRAIQAVLPPNLHEDVKNNIDAVVKSNFEQMNLVSREQLEIQQKVLARTRERVKELESRLSELERHLES